MGRRDQCAAHSRRLQTAWRRSPRTRPAGSISCGRVGCGEDGPPRMSAEEEFKAVTGLSPEVVSATGRAALRQWFRVASLDDPPERIRATTARFVELSWAARTPIRSGGEGPPDYDCGADGGGAVSGGEEHGGDYVLPARPASDAKIIERLHGLVWKCLATVLVDSSIGYRKWSRSPGYEIDMEIDAPGPAPLLVEIKTGCSISERPYGGRPADALPRTLSQSSWQCCSASDRC